MALQQISVCHNFHSDDSVHTHTQCLSTWYHKYCNMFFIFPNCCEVMGSIEQCAIEMFL